VAVHDGKESGASTIVELRNIHKTYLLGIEGVPALRGVTVSITKGEFIVILGKSGGGKTTMLNVIGVCLCTRHWWPVGRIHAVKTARER
jgi:ABC-type phosphate/phosphonate transport system ATPase subunit